MAIHSFDVSDLTIGKPALPWLPSSSPLSSALTALRYLQPDIHEISVWDCSCSPSPPHPPASSSSSSASVGNFSNGIPDAAGGEEEQEGEEDDDDDNSGGDDDEDDEDRDEEEGKEETEDCPLEGAISAPCWSIRRRHRQIPLEPCRCIGKVCMLDLVCFLGNEESLRNPIKAMQTPVAAVISKKPNIVRHIESDARLIDAFDMIIEGTENLIVPIHNPSRKPTKAIISNHGGRKSWNKANHNGVQYCWVTQEDAMRFLTGCIGSFSPLPMTSLENLGIIREEVLVVGVEDPADCIPGLIGKALHDAPIAVVSQLFSDASDELCLVGEISPAVLKACDETAAIAMATLSTGDFLTYIAEYKNPPREILKAMKSGLLNKLAMAGAPKKLAMAGAPKKKLPLFSFTSSSSSSSSFSDDDDAKDGNKDDEEEEEKEEDDDSVNTILKLFGESKQHLMGGGGGGFMCSYPITCRPRSSLVAVMLQALAHRSPHVWVTRDDGSLVGYVTFADIIAALFDFGA